MKKAKATESLVDPRQQIRNAELCRLVGGPYGLSPQVSKGDAILCAAHGLQIVAGLYGPKQWPRAAVQGRPQLIVFGPLIEALKYEARQAVACHWGVSLATVANWRRKLGISGTPICADRMVKSARMKVAHEERPDVFVAPGTRFLKDLSLEARKDLGVRTASIRAWKEEELQQLRFTTDREFSKVTGRSLHAVRSARRRYLQTAL